ncbi:MAG: hypothetical protein GSR80_000427 [Desulfurococcales archaeon]|nr:hypothetical protein [Desulfurococcales archaeon]
MESLKPRPTDVMVKCLAELIRDGEVVYHGLTSQIPVLAMAYAWRRLGRRFTWLSVSESNMPVVERVRVEPSSGGPGTEPLSVGVVTTMDVFDLAARGRVDVMFFGAAQIDAWGNTNLTVIGSYEKPKVKLPGGAATAFLFPLVKRILIWARHDRRTLVERVDFVTGQGRWRVERGLETLLCTNKALIEFTREGPVLRALHPGVSVEEAQAESGFKLLVPEEPRVIEPPDELGMRIIWEHDPEGLRYLQKYG